jgi:hypothetical protein
MIPANFSNAIPLIFFFPIGKLTDFELFECGVTFEKLERALDSTFLGMHEMMERHKVKQRLRKRFHDSRERLLVLGALLVLSNCI